MKSIRHFFVFLLALVLLCASTLVFAADNWLFLQAYQANTNALRLVLSDPTGATEAPNPGQFEITFNGESLPIRAVSRTDEVPTTFYCIMDISGLSQNAEQFQLEKEVLYAICDKLSEGDRMVVATMGETLVASGYLNDPAEIRETIRKIQPSEQQTNLYRSLVDAVSDLSTSEQATERKCVVILSDGQNYYTESQFQGAAKDRADTAIRNSRIPVYTIPVVSLEQTEEEWYKKWYMNNILPLFVSFSEESAGGENFDPQLDQRFRSGAEAGAAVIDSMKRGLVLDLDLGAFQKRAAYDGLSNLITLSAKFVAGDGRQYTDSLTVAKTDLSLELEKEIPWLYIGIGIAGVVIISLIVLILVLNGKRKRRAEEDRRRLEEEARKAEEARRKAEADRQRDAEEREMLKERLRQNDLEKERERQKKAEEEAARRRYAEAARTWQTVQFSSVGTNPLRVEFRVPEKQTVTVGKGADFTLNPNDSKLSRVHFRLLCQGHTLRIWDGSDQSPSTNGTAVDNVRLQWGRSILISDDGQDHYIQAGSYTYRIRLLTK